MNAPTSLLIATALALAGNSAFSANDRLPANNGKTQDHAARARSWLTQADKNKDGKLSESETYGTVKSNFARCDANKDGFLILSELEAMSVLLSQTGRPPLTVPEGKAAPATSVPQQPISNVQLLARATPDITIVPDLVYREGHDRAWKLDLVMPKKRGSKPRPGIVFVHGGGWSEGDKRMGAFINAAIEYAQKGYVCVSINYRLIDEAPFPACIEDVKNAVRWFRANAGKYNLDPNRIGGYGHSAGAHLVCMLGLVKKEAGLEGDGPYQDQSSLLQAVCASAAPTDFSLWPTVRSEKFSVTPNLVKLSSPITYASKDAPPFLLIHGTADAGVNVKHADTLVEALKGAGAKDVNYLRIEGAGHGVFHEHSARTGPAMEAFFKRTLGGIQ